MASQDPYLLRPMTLLDGVNSMLFAIGSGAVQTLDAADLNSNAETALKTLHDFSVNLQEQGWQWNRERGMTLDPWPEDATPNAGRIALPTNTLKVDTVYCDADLNLVQRGNWLYDPDHQTYRITADGESSSPAISVKVDLIVALDFEELPQAARNYITIRAARQFAHGKLNNSLSNQFSAEEAMRAYVQLLNAEDESNDDTLLNTNGRIARRRLRFRRG